MARALAALAALLMLAGLSLAMMATAHAQKVEALRLAAGQAQPAEIPDAVYSQHAIPITHCDRVKGAVVSVAISHAWRADVVATLTDPSQEITVLLWTNLGGRGDDLLLSIGDDAPERASTQACNDDTPPGCEGYFRPELSYLTEWEALEAGANAVTMGALDGADGNGDWTLRLGDTSSGDVGRLNAASLTLVCLVPDPTYTAWLPVAVRDY